MDRNPNYVVRGVNLESIRNRNEERVLRQLPEVLDAFPDWSPQDLDVQDVYALTLNALPARYKQDMSIVLQESVSDDEIRDRLRAAVAKVRDNPKY